MLPDPYPVNPWTAPCSGEVRLPGSKSLTNRALVLSALGDGNTRLTGALFSRDSRILCESLEALGFKVFSNPETREITVEGQGGRIPSSSARINVGNAGTAARFLTALVCLHPSGSFHFDGDEEMRLRPMEGLIRTLESQGARFSFAGQKDHFPFSVATSGLAGGEWAVDASASSQMLSALMMVAPHAHGPVLITASGARPAFVKMTASLMGRFSVHVEGSPAKGYVIARGQSFKIPSGHYAIEPDVSAASYFMALPFVTGGRIKIMGLQKEMLQGDLAFADVLRTIGMEVEAESDGWNIEYNSKVCLQESSYCFKTFSDTFLTLAAIAPLLAKPVTIVGIGHTRFQETDRIAAMAEGLKRTGAQVVAGEDYLAIQPYQGALNEDFEPVTMNTFKDHRVAMSFALLGCSLRRASDKPWLQVADPACCGKTFPGFFSELELLYRISHDK